MESCLINKVAYRVVLSGWSLQQTVSLDKHLAAEYRRRMQNNKSYQEEALLQPPEPGGFGFRRLSSVIQDQKKSIVDRRRDSHRLACMVVSGMLERGRLSRDFARTMMLWGDSLIDFAATSNQRLRPLLISSTWGWSSTWLTSLLIILSYRVCSGKVTSPAARPLGVGSGRRYV